ncbi:MAG: Na+/H+ antiporter, NhaA family protein, nonfunctional [Candidatus Yanofskybacteria bacterium GW2011_GWA2_41_22]|uniref:Na+/H+ antiporter, NhaA family protein, nonfunctional n=5 Tax=Parcubacteria group TaxID=1794811 RepID=A0A0G0XWP8_9BACT|nr:MAG: Na+/H+ antiporter, NhaA family protein, nonfunctional [Candidatus Yanofskybacteria bacterium GW2011_GWA2_41_22]KKS25084.1 MAG: Na+/H+ antiporter, NhaA family protein, nonfunctional [Candidatus Jorgensenbacteria bacterium GW2011_GWF2_41_8]KKS26079.1 MAG: Na+/H+ antiporter, NhaA family protein, nonfunctional [Candidatus Yanofskybacteria bacterium GW2011_GWC2_41_9]
MEEQQITKKERWELKRQEKLERQENGAKSRLIKRFLLWALVLAGTAGLIFGMVKLGGSEPDQSAILINAVSPSDWTKGNKEAKVVLVEYSDFQCPACAYYYPLLKKLSQDFGDKVSFTYRHFPLRQHINARLAAYAAEAAGKQNKFWEMHDLIFENQTKWENRGDAEKVFKEFANSLDLNADLFKNDLDSKEIKDKVENDLQSGVKSQVNSTPTIFLNGKKIEVPPNYDELQNIINEAVKNNP